MQQLRTTCNKVHEFPLPKFKIGQKVKMISDDGYHHRFRVGDATVITGIATFLVDPCDEVEYLTEFGFGYIREARLEAVDPKV
jgi:hypothetical protein